MTFRKREALLSRISIYIVFMFITCHRWPATDVMIFKIFSPKKLAKILAFFAHTTASFWKNLFITLVFEKNANFFAENWRKSQKIVIITSNPGVNLLLAKCSKTKMSETVHRPFAENRCAENCFAEKYLRNRLFCWNFLSKDFFGVFPR
jgi:hypothetical protein